jgi:DNA repair exonuclease SbcCD ATPase subunit
MPPDGVVVIGGENESGKTSALRALELALAGGDAKPVDEPIHGNSKKGRVLATFGGDDGARYVVEKTWTRAKGKKPSAKLVIKDAKGKPQSSPQTLFGSFCDFYALDPVKFLKLDAREQARIVSELSGVDLSPFAQERDDTVTARRDANREVKRLKGALDSCPFNPDLPEEEESVAALTAELRKRQGHNENGAELERTVAETRRAEKDATANVEDMEATIERLREELAEAEERLELLEKQRTVAISARMEATRTLAAFEPADVNDIVSRISGIEEANRKIRDNARHRELAEELANAETLAGAFQAQLDDVDSREAEAKASAAERLPVEGLDITEDGLTYGGKPLSQAGRSASIRVAAAIAMAASQDRPVKLLLIDDGETLSPSHQRQIIEDATSRGFQVLYTIVSGRGDSHVELVDGVGSTS